jgi:hypothetical protein
MYIYIYVCSHFVNPLTPLFKARFYLYLHTTARDFQRITRITRITKFQSLITIAIVKIIKILYIVKYRKPNV